MVVFTCQGCNASLKKKQVSDHVRFCQKSPVLTCIDCLKDFDHTTSQKHLCTVTESQRYGGQNYVVKPSANKQALWVECALAVASSPSLSVPVKTLISAMAENPALPRNKKKFTNAVMNNAHLRTKQSIVEEAFDLIASEMEKRESEESDKTNGTGKRKTISETQEDPDAVSNSSNDEKKKEKKKKKKRDSSDNAESQAQETLGTQEVNDTAIKHKGKKSKRKTISETQPDVEPDEKVHCEQSSSPGDKAVEEKKKKKKKKSVSYEDEKLSPAGDEASPEDTENVVPGDCPAEGDSADGKQDITKLSKKERKKLLKQKKFAAELESIENYQRDEANLDESVDEKKKKKKKNKEIAVNGHESGKDTKAGGEALTEKHKGEVCEEEAEGEVQVEEKPKNFKWESVIREALKSASDHEMSLKRLSKKVCGEYVLVHGMKDSYDDILLRFNKKVVKTPGVKVFKDKAMLCHS